MKNNPKHIYTLLINLSYSGMEHDGAPIGNKKFSFMLHKPKPLTIIAAI